LVLKVLEGCPRARALPDVRIDELLRLRLIELAVGIDYIRGQKWRKSSFT
jgi:hypothetical protein